jgi:co-chaperonin GroES (HSP10)
MKSLYQFIVKPNGERYNNTKKIGDTSLLLNTSIESFRHINKEAIVVSTPAAFNTGINVGDTILIHHNIFRRYYDIKGKEKNGSTYFKNDMYFVNLDQVYGYKKDNDWVMVNNRCFVKPIKETSSYSNEKEQKHIGILKYGNNVLEALQINPGDLVGFTPKSEWEFIIDGERLYCMKSNDIAIKYERKGHEEEYNPSWAKSG